MALIPDPTTTRPPLPRFTRYGSAPGPGLRDPAVAPVNAGVAILAVAVIGALWAGQDIFVPIALAVLLSFVLAPAVRRLQAWRMPRAAAVPVVVLLAFAVILLIGTAVAMQVRELAVNLPLYQSTIREKAMTTRDALAGKGALGRAAAILEDLGRELKKPTASPALQDQPMQDGTVKVLPEQGLAAPAAGPAPPPVTAPPTPLPVEVHQPDPGPVQALSDMLAPVLRPLATAGLIVIFVVFILLQREDLRNRMIRLAGAHDIQRTTAAIDDAAHRLSRLYLAQLGLNAAFGAMIALGCWLIGLPSPLLWGIIAAVMRFVPYVGAVIAALFPLALALAVDPGWTMVGWTLALFAIGEPVVGHVVEPLLFGRSTGLSPVAVIVAAAFWTWLWGPIGLVLATPLTVCLVVLGRHVETLQFLDVMFGSTPPLSPQEVFYQRMLARDPIEAADQAEEFIEEASLARYYDEVAVPGLLLAQADLARGALDESRVECIRDAVAELVADLAEPAADPEAGDADGPAVLCLGGRNPLDEAAAGVLANALALAGVPHVLPPGPLSGQRPGRQEQRALAMVVLSYLDTSSIGHLRYAVRRMRRLFPGVPVMVAAWDAQGAAAERLRETLGVEAVAGGVAKGVREALRLAGTDPEAADERAEPARADADAPAAAAAERPFAVSVPVG